MRTTVIAAILGFLAAPVAADVTYQCEFDDLGTNGGWLPEIFIANISDDGFEATVNDPIILEFLKSPIEAEIVADNDERLTLAWKVRIKDNRNTEADMAYRVSIQKATKKATISAQPLPYDQQFRAQGTCQLLK